MEKDNFYDMDEVDDGEYEHLTYSQRAAVEEELKRRDEEMRRRARREQGEMRSRRMYGAMGGVLDEDDDDDDDGIELAGGKRKRVEFDFGGDMDDDDDIDPTTSAVMGIMGSGRRDYSSSDDDDDDDDSSSSDDDDGDFGNFEDFKGSMKEWIAIERNRRKVAVQFRRFLDTTPADSDVMHTRQSAKKRHRIKRESTGFFYKDRVLEMGISNRQSLVVEYNHMSVYTPILCIWIVDEPSEMLNIFNEVAYKFARSMLPNLFGTSTTNSRSGGVDNDSHRREVFVRINGLPVCESLRELRHIHLNQLIKVSGVVTRRTAVYPQLKIVHFECSRCRGIIGPIMINNADGNTNSRTAQIPKPQTCPHCQATAGAGSNAATFSICQSRTIYRNYQKLVLQESPGSVPAGRIPRSKDVILLNDLIDNIRPGEEVVITGIYKHSYDMSLNTRQGFPVFATIIEANHVVGGSGSGSSHSELGTSNYVFSQLTEKDKDEIQRFAKKPRLLQRIIKSIAPSIYGHDNIKLAIALSLFGGVPKRTSDGTHNIRGDINVLLVGDPGTAKSQFLKYVEKTAHRAVFTTGRGSTAVGLTASVRKDPLTKEWTLEGGALVLADHGVCLIDEFDKMNDQDRTSIHEAMEQQTISISKAGIVTTLHARCSIIAAANPVRGRYDSAKSFKENVGLSDPILSRFDVLCVVKDIPNPIIDEKLALFVVESHSTSHPEARKRKKIQEAELANRHLASQIQDEFIGLNGIDVEEEEEAAHEELSSPAHYRGGNNDEEDEVMDQTFLKKYIIYAKERVKPSLKHIDSDRLTEFYKRLRRESVNGGDGGLIISVRHFESLLRMAEACAKMHLRDTVTEFDINTAINVVVDSFIQTQKVTIARQLRNKFKPYLMSEQQDYQFLLNLLNNCLKDVQAQQIQLRHKRRRIEADIYVNDDDDDDDEDGDGIIRIEYDDFANAARSYNIFNVKSFLKSDFCKNKGFEYREAEKRILFREEDLLFRS